MGCNCSYSNMDGKQINPWDEEQYTIDNELSVNSKH